MDWTVWGLNPGGGRDFPRPSRPALGPTQPPVQWVPGLFPGIKRPGRGVDHPPTSSTEVEGRVVLCSYSPSGLLWPVLGWTLYYTILYCTILYYTIPYCTILYYTILYYTILYYTILYTMLCYTIRYDTILYYMILYNFVSFHSNDRCICQGFITLKLMSVKFSLHLL